MIASGPMPRSPVWLRKIPSTVSGSQGSRRGFSPAVRFAFPLGAKMYITDFPAPGQGKVRIRAELFRRAGGFRIIVDVSPGRAIVTDGPLPPIIVEESPQPGGERGDGAAHGAGGTPRRRACPIRPVGGALAAEPPPDRPAASGSPTGPSRSAPRALRGTGVPHCPRHPPGIGGLSPWISPCGLGTFKTDVHARRKS